jgi:hypothetical protein
MKLNFVTALPNTGALLVSISGSAITSVTPAAGFQTRLAAPAQGATRLLIRASATAGTIADLQVAERKAAFTVTVLSAAANSAGNYALLAPGSYQLSVVRPP